MAVKLFLDRIDRHFDDWNVPDRESFDYNYRNVIDNELNLQGINEERDRRWNEALSSLNNGDRQAIIDEVMPWRYQTMKKIYPLARRNHSNLDIRRLPGNNKFINSYLKWQLLAKPLDRYFFNMDIKEKVVDQRSDPVNVIYTAAEENYLAVCTPDTIFFYRIDNVKLPIYRVEIGLESTIKSLHFYQNGSGRLIAIVLLGNKHLRFFDVKYRKEIIYPRFRDILVDNICVGTHHKFFTEFEGTIRESTTENSEGVHVLPLFDKKSNNNIFYMFSENDKLFVACHRGLIDYEVLILPTPVPNNVILNQVPKVNINRLKNHQEEIPQCFMPASKIILSVVDGQLKCSEWTERSNVIEEPLTLERRVNNVINPITAYTMHANILFIGFKNGYLQIIYRGKKKTAPNLEDDESKLIKLCRDSQPITSICVSEFKETLFIVASTNVRLYTIKFSF